MVTLLKIIVFFSAIIALGIATAFIFFYEQFRVFNELVNNRLFVGKGRYGSGEKFGFDRWVLGWHTFLGIIFLLIGLWLFYIFLQYWKL